MTAERGRCLRVILPLEENFRDKPGVSKVTCSVICHAGIQFHRILPEFKLKVSKSC